jgi:hypothetical protein
VDWKPVVDGCRVGHCNQREPRSVNVLLEDRDANRAAAISQSAVLRGVSRVLLPASGFAVNVVCTQRAMQAASAWKTTGNAA